MGSLHVSLLDLFGQMPIHIKKDMRQDQPNQNLQKYISDSEGHYDIDGVSFDWDLGVVVASDGIKNVYFLRSLIPQKRA